MEWGKGEIPSRCRHSWLGPTRVPKQISTPSHCGLPRRCNQGLPGPRASLGVGLPGHQVFGGASGCLGLTWMVVVGGVVREVSPSKSVCEPGQA